MNSSKKNRSMPRKLRKNRFTIETLLSKIKLTLLAFLISIVAVAQNGINFKALIKDTNGNVMASSPLSIQFIIYQDDALTLNVYKETHTTNTDDNGFVIVNIGEGTTSDNFDSINWSTASQSLNVQVNTGSGFVDLGTSKFKYVPYSLFAKKASIAENVSGLEAIDEGNGIGWRLIGNNPNSHGDIGLNAVDLTNNYSSEGDFGAIGQTSFTAGTRTIASGPNSTAFGNGSVASGGISTAFGQLTIASALSSTAMGQETQATSNLSTAMGYKTIASAVAATAMGYDTTASGSYSTAMGRRTEASGDFSFAAGFANEASGSYSTVFGVDGISSGFASTALGSDTTASGNMSTSMGFITRSEAFASIAIGRYNIGGGNATEWNTLDPLFEIGNGSDNNRHNALTVLKNGYVGIGTNTPQELFHISGGRLRIGSETIEDTGNNRLSFNADLLPDINNGMQLGNSSFRWLGLWATDGTINTSDRRDKTNIKDLHYGLSEILQMNPVSFNWKNRKDQDTKLGLIAQDLLKLVPEVVKTHDWQNTSDDENAPLEKVKLDRLGVYYSDLIPVLINAIKEQQNLIDDLKTIINKQKSTLKNREATSAKQAEILETLLSRVDALEYSVNQ